MSIFIWIDGLTGIQHKHQHSNASGTSAQLNSQINHQFCITFKLPSYNSSIVFLYFGLFIFTFTGVNLLAQIMMQLLVRYRPRPSIICLLLHHICHHSRPLLASSPLNINPLLLNLKTKEFKLEDFIFSHILVCVCVCVCVCVYAVFLQTHWNII